MKSGWIRVEDELPKDNQPVIIYSALKDPEWENVLSDFRVGTGWYHDGEWSDKSYPYRLKVTHWRPFPEPPEIAPPAAQ